MNKPIYLGLSILEISKTTMYEFWHDYMKRKYGDMVKLCYTDTDSLVMNIKTKDFDKDIAKNVEERFDTSNYVSIVFVTQSYFRALKDARLNSTPYIIMKINNKKELKRIAEEKSGYLDYKDFLKMYNYCTKEPYSFMTIYVRPTATIPFKKNFNDLINL